MWCGCVGLEIVVCVQDDCFKVEVVWVSVSGDLGVGCGLVFMSDMLIFWFFDLVNIELVVKNLDVCVINDFFWVFVVGVIDVEVDFVVMDIEFGIVCLFFNLVCNLFEIV